MPANERKRNREWLLLLLLLFLGIVLMFLVGFLAIRQPRFWSVEANMGSKLNLNQYIYGATPAQIGQVRAEIMTQPAWMDTYLTPGGEITPTAGVGTSIATATNPGGSATASPPATVTLSGSLTPETTVTATLIPSSTPYPTGTVYYPPPTNTKEPPPKPTNTPVPAADLSITKTDGITTYTPGGSVTYTIAVSNAGPDDVTGATVTDSFPAQIASASWTCAAAGGASCSASGAGNISDTVDLPVGDSVTYTVTANISGAATGNMTNTAAVSPPADTNDPNTGNNTASDTDTETVVAISADLSITKDDGVSTYTPGGSVTYTITVLNDGPDDVTGATVTDTFPSQVDSASWTCVATGGASCTASGTGDLNDTINIPNGDTAIYTVTANINAGATGNMSNTATVSVPSGISDPVPGDNSATDSDTKAPASLSADLSITKDDGVATYTPDGSVTYTIVVSNAGPDDVTGVTVRDNIPSQIASWDWACTSVTNATGCDPVTNGTSNFSDIVDIDSGGSIHYTVSATIKSSASGDMTNTASVTLSTGVSDPDHSNNANSDTDTYAKPDIDLSISKTDGSTTYSPGNTLTYTIVVTNPHASVTASGFNITDDNVPLLQDGSWSVSCTASSGGDSCGTNASSDDDVAFNGASLSAGETLTVSITGRVSLFQSAPLVNTANIIIPGGASFTDPNLANNSAQDISNATLPSCDKTIAVSGIGSISLKSWDVTCLTFNGTDGVIISASNAAWTYLRWAGENEGGSSCGVYGKTIFTGSITDAYIDNNGASITLYAQPFFIDDTLNITSISDWTGGCP